MSLLIDEAIGLVNTEIRILNMQIKYPVQFQNRKNKLPLSPLYLTDETYLIEIMEIVSGLFLSKRVVTRSGTEAPLTEIGRAGIIHDVVTLQYAVLKEEVSFTSTADTR